MMTMHPAPDDDVAQRYGYRRADDLLDDGRVDRDARGDFGGPNIFEEAGSEAKQIAVHREPDVGDGPLAEPGNEVEADCGGEGHHRNQHQQIFEPTPNVLRVSPRRRSLCR